MQDDPREESVAQLLPEPYQLPGGMWRRRGLRLDLHRDDVTAPELGHDIDLSVSTLPAQVGKTWGALRASSARS